MQSIAVPVSLTIRLQPAGADIGSLERAVSAGLAEAGRQLWARQSRERTAPASWATLGRAP
jgi:hypothetical protein